MRKPLLALPLLLIACAHTPAVAPRAEPSGAITFIEDDYPRALDLARAQHMPLFVDAWAPWCHTCRFMRAYVFPDAALARHASRFVWLSIDTDKPSSAAFMEKYPLQAWPTLFVIDPRREVAVLKWLGSATVPDLDALLVDGEAALQPQSTSGAAASLARADAAQAQGRLPEALAAYREALTRGGADWAEAPRVIQSLLGVRQLSGDLEGCAHLAREKAPSMKRGGAFANTAAWGLGCALEAKPDAPWRAGALAVLRPLADEAVKLPGLLADDRSGVYEILLEDLQDAHRDAEARALAGEWLGFLEAQAARAPDATRRSVFDAHRVEAALALGDPARAMPALEASARDFPDDYNPPYREALLERKLGKLPEALAAIDRALALVQGPRALRVLTLKAELQDASGRRSDAQATLKKAIALGQALPPGQRSAPALKRLQSSLAKLGGDQLQ